MTACPISNGLADDVELPRTMTTLCMSSIPADVDATDENSSKFRRTCSSPTSPSISPSATATPSAEAPREYATEPYALFVTVLFPRADAASIRSLVKSWHLALPDLENFRYIPLVTFDHGKSICHTKIEGGSNARLDAF